MTYKISHDRLCVNRKIAPNLSLDRFFSLVEKLGLNKVEIRNDMKSGSVTDYPVNKFVIWLNNMRSPSKRLMRFIRLTN